MMPRVTGIGGVFMKAKDPKALKAWYQRHLGVPLEEWGGAAFAWRSAENPDGVGTTVWSLFEDTSDYFDPSPSRFMINYRVDDLHGLLAALRSEGCDVDEKVQDYEYGKFGWVMDPEGNRVELWEPPPGR
jgi:predicted enzyme related to lactoylglutathione lyase